MKTKHFLIRLVPILTGLFIGTLIARVFLNRSPASTAIDLLAQQLFAVQVGPVIAVGLAAACAIACAVIVPAIAHHQTRGGHDGRE